MDFITVSKTLIGTNGRHKSYFCLFLMVLFLGRIRNVSYLRSTSLSRICIAIRL